MHLLSSVWTWMRVLLRIIRSVAKLFVWYVPPFMALFYSTARVTVVVTIATVACAVYWYTQRSPRGNAEHPTSLPLQPLGRSARWLVGLALVAPFVEIAIGTLSIRLGYPLDKAVDPITPYLHRPGGLLAFGTVAVLAAPVLEEFAFRGWIQSPLEREFGAPRAIAITALLFALIHLEPLQTPFLFFGGVVMGTAVYLTRSIWAGVAIHFGNNLLVTVSDVPRIDAMLGSLGPARWWKLLPFLVLSIGAFLFLFRGLWRATRCAEPSPLVTTPAVGLAPSELPP